MDNNTQHENPASPHTSNNPDLDYQQKQWENNFHYKHWHHGQRHWFGSFFWGLFIILIGVIFLARSLGYLPGFDVGVFFSRFWPVFVIFAGLSIMSRGGLVAGIVSAIIALVILAFLVAWIFRIPVTGRLGSWEYNVRPQTMDNWMMGNGGMNYNNNYNYNYYK